ncbi:hypothetical protein MC885_021848 [Smutsia gigantea]|nr:hypothetical protein MC885_021848 [Smutsia gigantea]
MPVINTTRLKKSLRIWQMLRSLQQWENSSAPPILLLSRACLLLGYTAIPQRATPTATTAAAVSTVRSNEGANNQEEERPRSSQAQPATELFHRGPLDQKVTMLVYYLLYKYQMKEPITKEDMLRHVIQMYKNHFCEILKRASEHLVLVFGLDMKKVDPNRSIYVLVNKVDLSHNAELSDDRGVPKTGALMTILGVIFMKGNCATEDQYLEYCHVPNSNTLTYEFLWGLKARTKTSKMKVLELVAKIKGTTPTAFPSHYEEAL